MSTGVSSLLKNLHGQISGNPQPTQQTNMYSEAPRGSQIVHQAPWGPVTRTNAETQTVNHGPWGASKVETAAQTVYHAPWGAVTRSDSENQSSSYLAPWGVVTRKPEQDSQTQAVHLTPWGPLRVSNNNSSEGTTTPSSVCLPGGPPPRSTSTTFDANRSIDVSTMFMRSQGDINPSRWRPDESELSSPPLQDSQNIPSCTTYSVLGNNIVQESSLRGEPIVPPSSFRSGAKAASETQSKGVPAIPPAVLICASLD